MLVYIEYGEDGKPFGVSRYEIHADAGGIKTSSNSILIDSSCITEADDMRIIEEYRVLDGALCYTGQPPSAYHTFDVVAREFKPNADVLRKERLADLKKDKQNCLNGGFEVFGVIFDSDANSRLALQIAYNVAQASILLGLDYSEEWILKDNSTIMLSANDMVEVFSALGRHVSYISAKAQSLRKSILSANTLEEILHLTWVEFEYKPA